MHPEFIKNNKGFEQGRDLPDPFLADLYHGNHIEENLRIAEPSAQLGATNARAARGTLHAAIPTSAEIRTRVDGRNEGARLQSVALAAPRRPYGPVNLGPCSSGIYDVLRGHGGCTDHRALPARAPALPAHSYAMLRRGGDADTRRLLREVHAPADDLIRRRQAQECALHEVPHHVGHRGPPVPEGLIDLHNDLHARQLVTDLGTSSCWWSTITVAC